jgi:ABC-type cobalamin transport system ATPase subunit
MIDTTQQLRLPKITKVILRNFSLYSAEPTLTAEFGGGVFCLAGANGLGKSTFLAAVNYGLTGIVPEPGRSFQSVEEFYKYNLDFAKDFFTGRVSESDRETAEVQVELRVGTSIYTIVRGMFEPDELRDLTVRTLDDGTLSVLYETSDETPRSRHQRYARALAADVGLNSFEQFTFLQHFVFTFDERRHLLFWDEKVLDQVLYLAFGVDHAEAQRADQLRRESERADSLARNHNWQATELRKKIQDLNDAVSAKPADDQRDLVSVHKSLFEEEERSGQRLQDAQDQLSDTLLRLAEVGAQYATLRSEYEAEFSRRMSAYSSAGHHPLIALSINVNRCEVCGTGGELAIGKIVQKLDSHLCPLCESMLQADSPSPDVAKLQQLDAAITKNKGDLAEASQRHKRVTDEIVHLKGINDAATAALKKFEEDNAKVLRNLTHGRDDQAGSIDLAIQRYRAQYEELLAKKKHQYDIRDDKRKSLLSLQKKLVKQYQDAEERFVPSFKRLARSFLGIDLDISLQPKSPVGLSMQLEVKSLARRHTHQLSESQRFFVDIALRMALIIHMSGQDSKGMLLIDTPEGSLDIAYENRAGDMFASFVELGYGIVMTANINSSRLLLALAERCGKEAMQLCRMTAWTELSDVQIGEEALFDSAYSQIEKALAKKSSLKQRKPTKR